MHTLPPPILHLDVGEGGTGSILPWIRKRKQSSDTEWTHYSDAMRQQCYDLLHPDIKAQVKIRPAPLIDVVSFDNMSYASYNDFVVTVANFPTSYYNSLALDSLQEFSILGQNKVKGEGNEMELMNSVNFGWASVQERAGQMLRKLRNYRDQGVFIYMTASEDISKDYVKSPMEKKKGEQPSEPYNIRGTVNLPGKLAEGLAHLPDILCHARLLNSKVTWVTEPEPIAGGQAWWDAKDRYGRLATYIEPDVRLMCIQLFGQEGAKAIYALHKPNS